MTSPAGAPVEPREAAAERRYRWAIRAYSRGWRDRNGEELLGVLLDVSADEDRRVSRRRDLVDVVVHGMVERCSPVGRLLPTATRDRIATLALASGSALSLVLFVLVEWAPGQVPLQTAYATASGPAAGSFLTLGPLVYVGWALTLAAGLLGNARMVRALAVGTVVCTLALPLVGRITGYHRPVLHELAALTLFGVLAGGVSPYGSSGRPRPLRLAAVTITLTCALSVTVARGLTPGFVSHWAVSADVSDVGSAVCVLAVVAAPVLHLARVRRWSAPLLISAVPWAVYDAYDAQSRANAAHGYLELALLALVLVGAAAALASDPGRRRLQSAV